MVGRWSSPRSVDPQQTSVSMGEVLQRHIAQMCDLSKSTSSATVLQGGTSLNNDAECYMMTSGSRTAENRTAVLDGGCTHSAWCDIDAFDLSTLQDPNITGVRIGDGTRIPVKYSGTVDVNLRASDGGTVSYRRQNVLYVPGLKKNLISERQEWSRFGTRIAKEDVLEMALKVTTLKRDGRHVVTKKTVPIIDVGDLYGVKYQPKRSSTSLIADADDDDGEGGSKPATRLTRAQLELYKMWHARLGDANPTTMAKLVAHSTGTPLKSIPIAKAAKARGVCPTCARTRMKRSPIGDAESKPTIFLDRIEIDVWGPSPVAAVPGGETFMILIVDVATGWIATFLRRTHTAADIIDCLTLFEGDVGGRAKEQHFCQSDADPSFFFKRARQV